MSSERNDLKSSAILALYQATPTLSLLCNTHSLNQAEHHKWTNQLPIVQLPSLANTSVLQLLVIMIRRLNSRLEASVPERLPTSTSRNDSCRNQNTDI